MASRVGWPRGKILRDVIRTNFSDTLQYRTKINRLSNASNIAATATSQLARHVSTEPKTDAAGCLPQFRSFGDDMVHRRGLRDFSTKNRIKRLATKSAKQRPESKPSLRKIEKGKSSHSVTTDIAGKFKKIHKKTERKHAQQTHNSTGLSRGSGGGGGGSVGAQPQYSSPHHTSNVHHPVGLTVRAGGAGGGGGGRGHGGGGGVTAGARMQELRQVQKHHDPVRLMGKNLEAEYIPRPVTKYRCYTKTPGSSLDNPIVSPISAFTKKKQRAPSHNLGVPSAHVGGGGSGEGEPRGGGGGRGIQPGSNSRFDSRNKLMRDGRIPLSKKQRSNPQLGHLPFDPHDVVNRSIKYPIPEEVTKVQRREVKHVKNVKQKESVPTTTNKKSQVKDDVIRRTARRVQSPKGRFPRTDEILGPIRADYLDTKEGILPPPNNTAQRIRPKRRQPVVQETFINENHNVPLHPRISFKPHAPKPSVTKIHTRIPDYGQSRRSLNLDEWSDPTPGPSKAPGSELPKVPPPAVNTLDLRSSSAETSFAMKPQAKRANLKSKRASQLSHHNHYAADATPGFQYPRPSSRKLSRSLFKTVDKTYLKMTSPKPPEKKAWQQPETFVPLDIPKPRQNWDSRRLKEIASVKRTATTSAWTMSKNRALRSEKLKAQNQAAYQAAPSTVLHQQASSIVKKLKVREPMHKSLSYDTVDSASDDSIKGSAAEQKSAGLGQKQTGQINTMLKTNNQRSLNLDGLGTYKTKAPYPSFAESFKMMPRQKPSSGMRQHNMQMYDYSTASSVDRTHQKHDRHSEWKKEV